MATSATPSTLKTASVLAFERKLDPSDALFYAACWDDRENASAWTPVAVREKSVRGTISNRLKGGSQDVAKLNAAIQSPNLQTVDVAALPGNSDTLKTTFTLKVLGGTGVPSACNNADYQQKLRSTVAAYVAANGYGELARRYAWNLANARFLWRNRSGAEQVEVVVTHWVRGAEAARWTFTDALTLSTRTFDNPSLELLQLADVIASGLAGEAHVLLQVTAFARVGAGQEVYPSQELILDKANAGGKSKTLYEVAGIAGIHSQKIGNAVRTIDTWHPEASVVGPIAVEPYGSVTTLGKACRPPADKLDFYNLLDGWLLKDRVPPVEQQHFVVATLIRGGVFGDAA